MEVRIRARELGTDHGLATKSGRTVGSNGKGGH